MEKVCCICGDFKNEKFFKAPQISFYLVAVIEKVINYLFDSVSKV